MNIINSKMLKLIYMIVLVVPCHYHNNYLLNNLEINQFIHAMVKS